MTAKDSRIDLTGKRFGKLTVIQYAYTNKHRQPVWLCKCDCGNEKMILGSSMKVGNTKSCGCISIAWARAMGKRAKKEAGVANFNAKYASYKKDARRRNLSFELTRENFKSLIEGKCYYCDVSFYNKAKGYNGSEDYRYNGIDRMDNDEGYTIDNCVSCCGLCNKAKRNLSLTEFYEWIERIAKKYNAEEEGEK